MRCYLESIFKHQEETMALFRPIEEENQVGYALVRDIGWDMQDCRWQALVKDFTQRTTEELIEAREELELYQECRDPLSTEEVRERARTAFEEELIDALHFLTEGCHILGVTPDDIFQCEGDRLEGLIAWRKQMLSHGLETFTKLPIEDKAAFYYVLIFDIIAKLHRGTNELKSRAWKRKPKKSSPSMVNYFFIEAYRTMITLADLFGMSAARIYEVYMRKNATNIDRAG